MAADIKAGHKEFEESMAQAVLSFGHCGERPF